MRIGRISDRWTSSGNHKQRTVWNWQSNTSSRFFKAIPHRKNSLIQCGMILWYNEDIDKQMTTSAFSDELSQVRTKKEEFLSQIEQIVPWKEWLAMIRPCYYKGEYAATNLIHWRLCSDGICYKTSMTWVTKRLWRKPSTAARLPSFAEWIPAIRFRTGIRWAVFETCWYAMNCRKNFLRRWSWRLWSGA